MVEGRAARLALDGCLEMTSIPIYYVVKDGESPGIFRQRYDGPSYVAHHPLSTSQSCAKNDDNAWTPKMMVLPGLQAAC